MKNIYVIIIISVCILLVIGVTVFLIYRPRSSRSLPLTKSPASGSVPVNLDAIIKSGNIFNPVEGQKYNIKSTKGYMFTDSSIFSVNPLNGTAFSITKTPNGFTIVSNQGSYVGFIDLGDGTYILQLSNNPVYWNIVYSDKNKDKVLLSTTIDNKTIVLVTVSDGDIHTLNGIQADTLSSTDNILFEMLRI